MVATEESNRLARERHIAVLQAFVLRARRIRDHSLARNPELLNKHLHPQVTVQWAANGVKIIAEVLPEEQVESAAARVRPLILKQERTHHANVMNALLFFAKENNAADVVIDALRHMKKTWATVNPDRMSSIHYRVLLQESEDSPVLQADDVGLGFGWIYGDVVHADPKRREVGRAFGIEARFRAAIPIVIKLMMLAMKTLILLEELHKRGEVPDLGDVFEEEVTVSGTHLEQEGEVYYAPWNGTDAPPKAPPMRGEFGSEWHRLSDDLAPREPKG